MEIEELQYHWKHYRAAHGQRQLSEEELIALLDEPAQRSYGSWWEAATRYAAVYGFLICCCQSC